MPLYSTELELPVPAKFTWDPVLSNLLNVRGQCLTD